MRNSDRSKSTSKSKTSVPQSHVLPESSSKANNDKNDTKSDNDVMTVRVQSSAGMRRFQVHPREYPGHLFDMVIKEFSLEEVKDFVKLFSDKLKSKEIFLQGDFTKSIKDLFIFHGDLLYLTGPALSISPKLRDNLRQGNNNQSEFLENIIKEKEEIEEDDIDAFLTKQDGLIQKPCEEKLCRHSHNTKCIHCSPIEPYDENYLNSRNPPIKFLPFHAYVKKELQRNGSKTSSLYKKKLLVPLENTDRYLVKADCKEHLSWPRGICSKCQPLAITLNRQIYRHVDNIVFENADIVDKFIEFWRQSSLQRFGFLYGKFEAHSEVPLGVKAIVKAIYEPPQYATEKSVELLQSEYEDESTTVENMTKMLGLSIIGLIFTDLENEDDKSGKVKCLRNKDTYVISAQECITAAFFQNKYPRVCKNSVTGYFGSKFVTVILTGNESGGIKMEGYQVSDRCMSLVKEDLLFPTHDAPELAYTRDAVEGKAYLADIFYSCKDEYNNDKKLKAKPLPVEYLIVDIPTTTLITPQFFFSAHTLSCEPFPIENRLALLQLQNTETMLQYLSQFCSLTLMEAVSDFHFLLFFLKEFNDYTNHMNEKDTTNALFSAVKDKSSDMFDIWLQSGSWLTIKCLLDSSSLS